MNFAEFFQYHLAALELDEIRFNVAIPVMVAERAGRTAGLQHWTLGAPGHCAIRSPGRSILLGALDGDECRQLARGLGGPACPGVMGSGGTAGWFVEEAALHGVAFGEIISQRIHALTEAPRYPGAEGSARTVTPEDAPLLFEWMREFHREAVPHDPAPQREDIGKAAASGRYLFWTVAGEPVSMAAIVRSLKTVAAIGAVYTPPGKRGRGYAGSVTAAVSERIFAEGKRAACLYADLDNPHSNRCYAKVGFKPYCDSWQYLRLPEASSPEPEAS
ncbi:MAG: GNAT family N-acetyltransferase [Rhodomicrobium sp.]